LLIALVGVVGSLFLSAPKPLGLDLKACPLCFYQRTLMLAVFGVLLMGLVAGPARSGLLSVMTLPLTVAGLAVAGWHVYLEVDEKLECPDGALIHFYKEWRGEDDFYKKMVGQATAPRESLTVFALLFLVQFIDVVRSGKRGGPGFAGFIPAVLLGAVFAGGLWFSVKDLKPQPMKDPQGKLIPDAMKTCHKPE
jgi:disulfide bond formation protein DsbB